MSPRTIQVSDDPLPDDERSRIATRVLAEGDNVVQEANDGGKLILTVTALGSPRYRAVAGDGTEYPVVIYQDPDKQHWRVCACFPDGDRCWWEPMPGEK
jgi:hypothetical protein